jgi:VanZ family protein
MPHPPPFRIRLAPLALAVVLFGTAIPVELRAPVSWSLQPEPRDLLINVLLYAPLGLSLATRSVAWSAVIGLLLSAAIEVLQMSYFGRQGALFDVIANALGAVGGALVGRWLARRNGAAPTGFTIDQRAALWAVLAAAALVFAWHRLASSDSLAGWDRGYDVLLGNESTSDRPWRGTLSSLALLPGRDAAPGTSPAGAYHLPSPVSLDGSRATRLPADSARRFLDSAVERNAFTVVATIVSADTAQAGPARIVSYSRGPFHRNFDLGQDGRGIVFRVRTPSSGLNGMHPHAFTPPVLNSDRPTTIVASFDGAVSRIHVDGQPHGRVNLFAAGCTVPTLCDTDLPLAAALFGFCVAIAAVGTGWPRSRRRGLALIVAAGLAAAAALRLLEVDGGVLWHGWGAPLLALLGASLVTCAAPPCHSP